METDQLISVLIPCYNHESYIELAIQSVLEQENVNLEVLVMDDCSQDRSADVIAGIEDARVRRFFLHENHGVVYAINALMKESRGEYIAFLGSDDLFKPGKLRRQMDVLAQNPEVGAVFTWAEVIDQNGVPFVDNLIINHALFHSENGSRAWQMRSFFDEGNRLCHSSALIRRSVYEQVGGFQQIFRQLHDFEYWIRVLCRWDIFVLQEELTQYRRIKQDNRSISAESDANRIRLLNEYAMVYAEMFEQMPERLLREAFTDYTDGFGLKRTEQIRFEILSRLKVDGLEMPLASMFYLNSVYDRTGRSPVFLDTNGALNTGLYRETAKRVNDYGFGIKKDFLELAKRAINKVRGRRE